MTIGKEVAMRAAIYYRVSTSDQSPQLQIDELRQHAKARGWTAVEYLDEGVSGRKNSRPGLDEMMDAVRKRKVDVVLVWKYDRFARSTQHLVAAAQEFASLGVDFVSYTQQVDTTTPMGKLFFTIMAGLAEFEADIISERVKAGMAAAGRKGIHLGRKPTTREGQNKIRDLLAAGCSVRQTAKQCKVSTTTVQKYRRSP